MKMCLSNWAAVTTRMGCGQGTCPSTRQAVCPVRAARARAHGPTLSRVGARDGSEHLTNQSASRPLPACCRLARRALSTQGEASARTFTSAKKERRDLNTGSLSPRLSVTHRARLAPVPLC